MWHSANELAPGTVIDTQVCIVGAGPAGLTLARELAGARFKVLLVESGDFQAHRRLKELNEGDTFGDGYPNPRWHRVRRVGGCANRWLVGIGGGKLGARFVPLDPSDFEKREWIAHSGWPIGRAELDPYYQRAQNHCGIGPYRYDLDAWTMPGATPIETDGLETSVFQFGPQQQWTGRHKALFAETSNVEVLLNATVMEIETDDGGGTVTGLKLVNDAGQPILIRSDITALAVGCVETTRLLLNSHAVHQAGLGNAHDVVGRYFMDHPQSYLNVFTPSDKHLFDSTGIYDIRPREGMAVMAKLAFKDQALRTHRLPNSCHLLFPRRDHFLSEGFQAFFSLMLDLKHLAVPRGVARRVYTMASGVKDLAPIALWALQGKAHYPYLSNGGWADLAAKSDLFSSFEIWSMVEQAPDPENRIRLGQRSDANGMPKVAIHWRFTDADRDGVKRMRAQFKHEIETSGLGTVNWSPDLYTTPSSVHPIGGARMGTEPRTSVVGPDLRVHGLRNLFAASSAVFPTSGYANPTLTVVALACRLADRIKDMLDQPIRIDKLEPLVAAAQTLSNIV